MAKTKVSEWDVVADNNQDISGITLGTGMPPSYVNDSIREMMAQIKDWQSGSSSETLNINGELKVEGSSGTEGQVIVSQGSGEVPKWSDAFVKGMIMLWSGSTDSIPSGWELCNGQNDTPDLRNKFVLGAHSDGATEAYPNCPPNATGGYEDAVVVSHKHTGSTEVEGDHHHMLPHYLVQAVAGTGDIDRDNEYQQWKAVPNQGTSTTGKHSHSFTTANQGESGTHKNLPPYYALAYIMKV
jgi:microcystin-dependent protein